MLGLRLGLRLDLGLWLGLCPGLHLWLAFVQIYEYIESVQLGAWIIAYKQELARETIGRDEKLGFGHAAHSSCVYVAKDFRLSRKAFACRSESKHMAPFKNERNSIILPLFLLYIRDFSNSWIEPFPFATLCRAHSPKRWLQLLCYLSKTSKLLDSSSIHLLLLHEEPFGHYM